GEIGTACASGLRRREAAPATVSLALVRARKLEKGLTMSTGTGSAGTEAVGTDSAGERLTEAGAAGQESSIRVVEHWIDGSATSGAANRRGPVWNPATGHQQAEVILGNT